MGSHWNFVIIIKTPILGGAVACMSADQEVVGSSPARSATFFRGH